MMHVGVNEMLRAMQKAKPPSIAILQPLIEKAKAEVAAKMPAPKPAPAAATAPAPAAKPLPKSASKNIYADSEESYDDPPPPPPPPPAPPKKETTAKSTAASKDSASSGGSSKTATAAATTVTKKKGDKKEDEEDFGPILQVSNKPKRMEEEKLLKTLKWNFDTPRKEFIEQLRGQMETAQFSRSLLANMFQEDFKFHNKALELLQKALEDCPEATVANLDLILRWLTLRFFETNPTVILKAIDYMQALFHMLATVRAYHLSEYEAYAFVPYFIGKLGDRQDSIRKGFRLIIKQIQQVYAPVKIFNFLLQALASKNARQRAECLEELGQMIEGLGLAPFNPAVTLKEIAKQIGDRDNSVRNAALNTVTVAHQIAGEQVYKYIGKINEKELSMLDERIKRSAKLPQAVKPSSSGSALNQQQQQQQQQPAMIHNSSSVHSISNNQAVPPALPTAAAAPVDNRTITRTPKKYTQSPTQPLMASMAAAAGGLISAAANSASPIRKREFTLDDFNDDEDDRDQIVAAVKLTAHHDLDDLLNKPVELPPKKNVKSYQVS